MLRMIAGLEQITAGRIEIDGTVVNDMAPVERGIAMVFQSYALYPHMSVFQNMAFALEQARTPAAEIETRVREAARARCKSRSFSRAGPRSCPAASASEWRSAARSFGSRRCSCSTSRFPISMRPCEARCASSCGHCTAVSRPT